MTLHAGTALRPTPQAGAAALLGVAGVAACLTALRMAGGPHELLAGMLMLTAPAWCALGAFMGGAAWLRAATEAGRLCRRLAILAVATGVAGLVSSALLILWAMTMLENWV